jgi:hypothetical protein
MNKITDRVSVHSYHSPVLRIYGSIDALTQTEQKAGSDDNPGNPNNMTGLPMTPGPGLLGPPDTTG